jgi:nucleotide-binding universal stress UspA family protein
MMYATMNKLSAILAAVDLSEPSLNALQTAACLAEKNDASLSIIHVQDNTLDFMGPNIFATGSTINHASNILTALAHDLQRKNNLHPIVIEDEGNPVQVVLKNALQQKFDLIVMGSYGASGYRDGFIGTTAYSITKYAPCPVLIIPPRRRWTSFKNILFPIRPALASLRNYDVLKNFLFPGSSLEVLGLSSAQTENTKELNKLVTDLKLATLGDKVIATTQSGEGNFIADSVLKQAEKNSTDLIVVTPAIDVSAKQFYIGPNAHKIIQQAKIPLLNINRMNVYAAAELK